MLKKCLFTKAQYIQFFVFIFFSMTFAVRSGTGYGAFPLLFIALISLPSLYRYIKAHPLTLLEKSLLTALIVFALLPMLSAYFEGLSGSAYDKPSRYLLCALTFLLLLRYNVSLLSIALGAWLGAIFAGTNALYDVFYLGMERAGGRFTVVIEFGDISLLLTAFVLLSYQKLKNKIPQFLIITSILLGLTAVILSQSRGGWIFIPLLVIIIATHYRNICFDLSKKKWLGTVFLLTTILVAGWLSAGELVSQRIKLAEDAIISYQKNDNVTPAVGVRFEMWKGGIQSIKNAPLFGGGDKGIITGKQQLIDQNKIALSPGIIQWTSVHNQYLDTWGKYGFFTFMAFLAIFFIPLTFFITQRNKGDADTRCASYCGITLCTGYLFFALTESIFTINSTVMFYSFSLIIFYSCAKTARDET
ncbi:O-antigen polymerase [Psychromonas ingrahamii 37]|uniref:O-antigen polymerase n=1 Tax=Psychromonas ingrahamii (strain DSM 17664 / CCUG 51855 / 37) TaxID=357804 RepID=A1SRT4_PSYIN|nr:O-antigen ligase family protein [Psychromonas ingrahamii]ABM02199.1 O-antigen polymerase [Psychromonas ingrahamii 37]